MYRAARMSQTETRLVAPRQQEETVHIKDLQTIKWVQNVDLVKRSYDFTSTKYNYAKGFSAILAWILGSIEMVIISIYLFIHSLPWPDWVLQIILKIDRLIETILEAVSNKLEWWWDILMVRLMWFRDTIESVIDAFLSLCLFIVYKTIELWMWTVSIIISVLKFIFAPLIWIITTIFPPPEKDSKPPSASPPLPLPPKISALSVPPDSSAAPDSKPGAKEPETEELGRLSGTTSDCESDVSVLSESWTIRHTDQSGDSEASKCYATPSRKDKDKWSTEQKSAIVEFYFANSCSITVAQRLFRAKFGLATCPTQNSIMDYVQTYRTTGSVVDGKRSGCKKTVKTEEVVERVEEVVQLSPDKSVRRHSLQQDIRRKTVHTVVKEDVNSYPYKMQVTQRLSPVDKQSRIEMCNVIQRLLLENPTFGENLVMTGEAHFHLSGYVKKHNCRILASTDTHEINEKPSHSQKVTVWCAISKSWIIGPYFYENERKQTVNMNNDRYYKMLKEFFIPELRHYKPDFKDIFFQQDGSACHTSNDIKQLLQETFPNHVVSKFGDTSWPSRSPDLTSLDFFLLAYLKSKVYITRPKTLLELKNNIKDEIKHISSKTLKRVMDHFFLRCRECLRLNGHYLPSVLIKK